MDRTKKSSLRAHIKKWIDEFDEFPFYIGPLTVEHFVKAVEIVYDAKHEAADEENTQQEDK